jgi:hypothetical protein
LSGPTGSLETKHKSGVPDKQAVSDHITELSAIAYLKIYSAEFHRYYKNIMAKKNIEEDLVQERNKLI